MDLRRNTELGLNRVTHRLRRVPVITLMPHSRCNCRCVMCDIWKANRTGHSISEAELRQHLGDFRKLKVEWVLLSGGEPLMHPNLWALCDALKTLPVKITLLSTGLLLARHAEAIVRTCYEVVVSLDGPEAAHDRIRDIPNAYRQLAAGVRALKSVAGDFPVLGRCVLQRGNFETLPDVVDAAREIGLDRISFLAADTSSTAFNRPEGWTSDRMAEIGLGPDEAERFANIVEDTIHRHASAFSSGFIIESPHQLRNIAQYFRGMNGLGVLPKTSCNAPWVSSVIETDGTVRPCFFHPAFGKVGETGLAEIINSKRAIAFRRALDVRKDAICRRCVCTLNVR